MGKKRKDRSSHYGPSPFSPPSPDKLAATTAAATTPDTGIAMGSSASLLPPLPQFSVSRFTLTTTNSEGDTAVINPTTTTTAGTVLQPDVDEWQVVKRQKKGKEKNKSKKRSDKNYPEFVVSPQKLRRAVQTNDLQGLILWLTADAPSPQWLLVRHKPEIRRTVVVLVPGLTPNMFDGTLGLMLGEETEGELSDDSDDSVSGDDEGFFPSKLDKETLPPCLHVMADMFTHMWPVRTTGDQRHNRLHSPLTSFLTCPVKNPENKDKAKTNNTRIKISDVVMTIDELVENEYVLHTSQLKERREMLNLAESDEDRAALKLRESEGWVETDLSKENGKDSNEAGSITEGKDIYAIDCEMCMVGEVFELTRISVIDWEGKTIYDTLVKPANPITDYLTPYSGITEEMLVSVTTTLGDVQAYLLALFTRDSVLVGQSLNSDLNAIRYAHPYIVDTSCIYHHARGPPYKASLKQLARRYLQREIQAGEGTIAGHSSVEDALACLDLLKLKLERGMVFGTTEDMREPIFNRLSRAPGGPKKAAVIDSKESTVRYGSGASAAIPCASDNDVVAAITHCAQGDRNSGTQQMDLTFAHLRALSASRSIELPSNDAKIDINVPFPDAAVDPSKPVLVRAVAETALRLKLIYDALPPCTAFVVFSGVGDTRRFKRLGDMQRRFREEFKVRKWDETTVRWTEREEKQWKSEYERARRGTGFMVVK